MYIIYIPKYKGDDPEYLIGKVLEKYISLEQSIDRILFVPGYMNVTEWTTKNFCNKIMDMFRKKLGQQGKMRDEGKRNAKENIEIGIFQGMNGNGKIRGTNIQCKEIHEKFFEKEGAEILKVKCKKTIDHRKMLFLIENIKPYYVKELSKDNCDEFMSSISVKEILIGSSNQNFTTYSGNKKAEKGEADILLFWGDEKKEDMIISNFSQDESLFKRIIIAKKVNKLNDEEFLNSLLKDYLNNNLVFL